MNKHTTSIVGFGILGSILAYNLATAWVGPSAAAPNNNATPPVNVGSVAQTKAGSFGITGTLITAGSASFGSGNAPAAFIDIGTNTALQRQAIFTRGADSNFRIIAQNGSATNASGQEVGRFGLEYNGSGWNSGFRFIRGGGALDGSLAIDTNGTERIRIDSAGNVGIGTTAPGGELDVWGGAGGRFIRVNPNDTGYLISSYNSSASNAEQFNIRHNLANTELRNERGNINFPIGNVGIGTTAPATKLDVAGTIRSTSGGFTFPDGTTQTTAATGGNYIQNQTAAAQSAANFRIAGSGRFVGGYGALGISGATEVALGGGGASPNAGSLAFGDNTGWKFNIGTNVASAFTPRFTFMDIGRLGINTQSPQFSLQVTDTAAITNTGGVQVLLMGNQDSGGVNNPSAIYAANGTTYIGGGTAWSGSGGTLTPTATFLDAGDVGIGTTSPSNTQGWNRVLDVRGTNHAKILVGSTTGPVFGGMFAHNPAWVFGSAGFYMGSESSHPIALMAGYGNVVLTGLTNGNIGIGTVAPAYKLDVAGAGSGAVTARLTNDNSIVRLNGVDLLGYSNNNLWTIGNASSVELNIGTAWDWDRQIAVDYVPGAVGSATGNLSIGQLQKNSATWTHGITDLYTNGAVRMRIDSAGNIGIGTTSPAVRLDVAGTIRSTSGGYTFPDGTTQTTAYVAGNMFQHRGTIANGAEDTATGMGAYTVSRVGYSDTLLNFPSTGSSAGVQIMANYNDELYFRVARDTQTTWDGVTSTQKRLLNSATDAFAANLNQNLRTTDGPTFSTIYTSSWLRSTGSTGWFNQTYNGGFFMQDSTWIRTHSNDSIWTDSGLLGTNGGLTVGYGGTSPSAAGAIISGNVGIGTSSASAPLDVQNRFRVNWSAPTYGTGIAAAGAGMGGWSRRYGFTSSDGATLLGGFGALGNDNALSSWWIGNDYNDYVASFDRATKQANFAGIIRTQNGNGYIDMGAMNTSWAHLQTDRPSFYTNKSIAVDGSISKYGVANQWADVNANSYMANNSIYSYGRICVGNNNGDCTGTGGMLMTSANIRFPDGTTQTTAFNTSGFHTNSSAGDWQLASSGQGNLGYGAATLELREANFGGSSAYTAPRLGFHWSGVVASQIGIESSGRITILNNPGTAYENLAANNIYAGGGISDSAGARMDAGGGWLRTYGDTGWYNGTYAGGWYMIDSTWVRTYNNKSIWTAGGLLGTDGGLTVGYGGTSPSAAGAIISGNVGIGTSSASAKLHVNGGGAIIGTTGSASNTRTLTILNSGSAQVNFGSYPGTWTSALQIQNNDNSRYLWMSPLSADSAANARIVTGGIAGLDIMPNNTAAGRFDASGVTSLTSTGYITVGSLNASYAHLQTDRPKFYTNVALDVNGRISKYNVANQWADLNVDSIMSNNSIYTYGRLCAGNNNGDCTGTGGIVVSSANIRFPDGTTQTTAFNTSGFHTNSSAGDWQLASSGQGNLGYGAATLELREANFGGSSAYTAPRLGFHWGGVVASQIGIESSGRIAILNNPGTGYENLIANNIYAASGITDSAGARMDAGGGWMRTYGDTGWYNGTYAGGWYMTDSTWVRTYNNKSIYAGTATIRTDGTLQVGASGSTLSVSAGGRVNGVNGYISSGNAGGTGNAAYFPSGIYANPGAFSGSANWIYGTTYAYNGTWYDSNDNNYYVDPASTSLFNDMRANIFYDRQNTGYYVDPNSTSNFNGLRMDGNLEINNGSPTIYFRDTNENSAMLHNNSNLLYVLRGGVNTTSWSVCCNGMWPMYWNLTNNDNVMGGNAYAFAYYYNSDIKFKKDIRPITGALEKINKLSGKYYTLKHNEHADIGLIAQEVQKVFPQVVREQNKYDPETNAVLDTYLTVDYGHLIAPVIEAIKELTTKVDDLFDKYVDQQKEIDELRNDIEMLKKAQATKK